jgi:hypothetical protein
MKLTLGSASAIVVLLAGCASLVSACSGSTTGGSGGSGGATPAGFCADYQAYATKCNVHDACTTAILADCTSFASVFSSGYLSAFSTCASEETCVDGGGTTASTCFASAQAALQPTAAQAKLATDYCASCAPAPQTPAQCAASFYSTGDGGLGIGSTLLDLNDTLTASIDTKCAETIGTDAGLLGCSEGFYLCLASQLTSVVTLPAACTVTTGGADGG